MKQRDRKEGLPRGHMETLRDDGYVHYLECGISQVFTLIKNLSNHDFKYVHFVVCQLYSIKLFGNVVYRRSYFSEKVPVREESPSHLIFFFQKALLDDPKPI